MSADIIDMKKKIIKKGKKRLTEYQQKELIYDELLDVTEEIQEEVTIPNMITALQQFTCDLAYDTAPTSTTATHLLLDIINHRLHHIMEQEDE